MDLICEKLPPGHDQKCNHNHGLFNWFPCQQPAVAYVWVDTEFIRELISGDAEWKYTSICGNYLCAGHLHLLKQDNNNNFLGDWSLFEPAPELAVLCQRVTDAYWYQIRHKLERTKI